MTHTEMRNTIIQAFRDWMLRGGFSPSEIFGTDESETLDEYYIDADSVPDTGLSVCIYNQPDELEDFRYFEVDVLNGFKVRDCSDQPAANRFYNQNIDRIREMQYDKCVVYPTSAERAQDDAYWDEQYR